jgi:hypothetical protein
LALPGNPQSWKVSVSPRTRLVFIIQQEVLGRNNRLLSVHYIFSIWYDTDRIENTASNSSSVVACVFVVAGTCLPSRSRKTGFSGGGGRQIDSRVIS